MEFTADEISDEKDIQLERIIRDIVRQFWRLLVEPGGAYNEPRRLRRETRRDAEIDEVVIHWASERDRVGAIPDTSGSLVFEMGWNTQGNSADASIMMFLNAQSLHAMISRGVTQWSKERTDERLRGHV